jgi:hypothetical protein
MNEAQLRARLRAAPVPSADEAEERGWRVALAAFESAPATPRRRRAPPWAIAVAIGLLLLALGLSPAGAKVADLFEDVTGLGEENARPALTSLPAEGRILVTTRHAAWVINEDGSKRRLGAYRDATWSPSGLFVAVTHGRSLSAVEPGDGTVHWSISQHKPVSDPAWAPSGYRVAYLAGRQLRVVAGDGTGDRMLENRVSPTAPAWLPNPNPNRNLLTYVDRHHVVRLVNVDSGAELWHTTPFGGRPVRLAWSGDGRRLLVFTPSFFVVLDADGRAVYKGAGHGARAAAFAPGGRRIAMVRSSLGRSQLVVLRPSFRRSAGHALYSGPGRFADVQWSPDASRLLVTWPDADQWLFVNPRDGNVNAIANISRQFAPGAKGMSGFPRVAGWCCAR